MVDLLAAPKRSGLIRPTGCHHMAVIVAPTPSPNIKPIILNLTSYLEFDRIEQVLYYTLYCIQYKIPNANNTPRIV